MRVFILFLTLSALGTGAYALDLCPEAGQVRQVRDLALRSAGVRRLTPRPQHEPRLELESERTWARAGYGYALLRVRNRGNVALEASAGRVRCTAFDAQQRTIGSWHAGDLGSIAPGQEIRVGIGIPLRKGRLESMDCRLVE